MATDHALPVQRAADAPAPAAPSTGLIGRAMRRISGRTAAPERSDADAPIAPHGAALAQPAAPPVQRAAAASPGGTSRASASVVPLGRPTEAAGAPSVPQAGARSGGGGAAGRGQPVARPVQRGVAASPGGVRAPASVVPLGRPTDAGGTPSAPPVQRRAVPQGGPAHVAAPRGAWPPAPHVSPPSPSPSPSPTGVPAPTPVQRDAALTPAPTPPPPPPQIRTTRTASTQTKETGGGSGKRAAERVAFDARALTDGQFDELVHRLIGPLTRLLRTEFRLDRERIGKLRDPRR
ncbi:hypothetical protein ACH4TX_05425 [Streptomyces sp. NPDC021098]|uniref:hypothetical protein n=1 Tax=unclassified Streptomyces TaxID=2593676 RepID=UPI0037A2BE3A